MSEPQSPAVPGQPSRRDFLKTSTAAVAGAALVGSLSVARSAHAAGDDQIKIALIGCGGRGSGAAKQALNTKGNVKLVAMGDVFPDRLEASHKNLMADGGISSRIDVPQDRKFTGFDAYQKVLDQSGCDLVILATPPGFRPIHFAAAVKAGKHIFMEKPVATDAPGVRKVLESAEEAKKKNLAVAVGLQRRHQTNYLEAIKRMQDGAIGDIVATRVYWNGTTPWVKRRADLEKLKGSPLTEMEYQLRNWYYFAWICGDHIVEQHIHNLDVINWLKQGHPVRANGIGGCEVRKGKDFGETFDHHVVEFEYPDGSRMFSQCRHQEGCWGNITEHMHGTKGTADTEHGISAIHVKGGESWKHARSKNDRDPYQVEHDDLFAAIREGRPVNEAEYGATSTMTAILGRMATYSGKIVEWDEAIQSKISLAPEQFGFDVTPRSVPGSDGLYPHPVPGITRVI